jgi:hypothetical protein
MITAEEAKRLYDQSGAEINDFLQRVVEPEIKKAATGGKRNCCIHLGSSDTWISPKYKPVELLAVTELLKLGYVARTENYGESYVPKALEDEGTKYRNYGIMISW